MIRLALLALPVLLALAASASSAAACPAPRPGDPPCTKYDQMFKRMAMQHFAPVYIRTRRAVLPPRTTSARAMRHLIGSTWTARASGITNQVIRVIDGADVPDVVDGTVYNAIVRGVTWRRSQYVVTIGQLTYAVQRCRDDRRRLTTCLVHVPE